MKFGCFPFSSEVPPKKVLIGAPQSQPNFTSTQVARAPPRRRPRLPSLPLTAGWAAGRGSEGSRGRRARRRRRRRRSGRPARPCASGAGPWARRASRARPGCASAASTRTARRRPPGRRLCSPRRPPLASSWPRPSPRRGASAILCAGSGTTPAGESGPLALRRRAGARRKGRGRGGGAQGLYTCHLLPGLSSWF